MVAGASPKEPTFFEAEYERGLEHYHEAYFPEADDGALLLDSRPANLLLPYVSDRIHTANPDARILAILRDPVERAASHWWQRVNQGIEDRGFAGAMEMNFRRLDQGIRFDGTDGADLWARSLYEGTGISRLRTYVDHGFYSTHLERYEKRFGRDQVKVVLLDSLSARPSELLDEIFSFVGVGRLNREIRGDDERNVALGPKAARLVGLIQRTPVPSILPQGFKDRVRSFLSEFEDRPPVDEETRFLLRDRYIDEIKGIEDRYEVDLSDWKAPFA